MIKSNPILWLIIFLAIVAPSFLLGAVTVVVYIVLGIFLLLFILSLYFRYKITKMRKNMEDQMRGGAQSGQGNQTNQNPFGFGQNPFGGSAGANKSQTARDEGDVKVYKTSEVNEKRVNKDVGDYVDFEEIKNK
ncbi:MAG: DUF4834 family protein [Rikenellaceae bacterium]